MKNVLRAGRAAIVALAVVACSDSKIVAPAAPLVVVIAPAAVTATKDQTITLSVIVKDSAGTVVAADSVRWSSSDAAKATVSGTGVVRTIQMTTPTISIQATVFKGRAQGSGNIPVTVVGPA